MFNTPKICRANKLISNQNNFKQMHLKLLLKSNKMKRMI